MFASLFSLFSLVLAISVYSPAAPRPRAGDSVGPGLGATFRLMTPNDISLCTVYIE